MKILSRRNIINKLASGEPIFEVRNGLSSYYMGLGADVVDIDTAKSLIDKYDLECSYVTGVLYSWAINLNSYPYNQLKAGSLLLEDDELVALSECMVLGSKGVGKKSGTFNKLKHKIDEALKRLDN